MNASTSAQTNLASLPPPQEFRAAGGLLETELVTSSYLHLLSNPSPAFRSAQPSQISGRSQHVSQRNFLAIGPFLANALGSRWQVYRTRICSCQEDFSEQSVHRLRVATRRLLAQLLIVGCIAPGRMPEKARRVLKGRLKALGELRDTHVQRLFIQRRIGRFPELILVEDVLQRRERKLQKEAATRVKGFKTRKLEKWILALQLHLATTPPTDGGADQLLKAVTRATNKAFAKLVSRRRAIDPAKPETIHRTRIAFKKFRYMVESLSPDFTGLGKRQLRALGHYQQRMGVLQDLEIIERCIAGYERQEDGIGTLLAPFNRYLQITRARALRSFLKSADDLFEFWPPPRVGPRLMIPQPPDQGRITDDTHDQDRTPEVRQDQVPGRPYAS